MLSDRDRALLEPLAVPLRAARSELAAAERQLSAAERHLTKVAGDSDWRDRALGGLFSQAPEQAGLYRDARRARKQATAVIADATARVGRLAARLDERLDPMLSRADPEYRMLQTAVQACDRALPKCLSMARLVSGALDSARHAQQVRRSVPKGEQPNPRAERDAHFAERRCTEQVRNARAQIPALRTALDLAAEAVHSATGLRPDPTPLTPPVTGHNVGALRSLTALRTQVDAATRTVTRSRHRTEAARKKALRAAGDAI